MIQGELANPPPDSTKYQIVVRANELEKDLPIHLETRDSFHVPPKSDGQGFREERARANMASGR
jgi:hypothetical protein